jgi:hypothetical protein
VTDYPIEALARDLGFMQPDDVRVVARWLFPGVRGELSAMMCGEIRAFLDPWGIRTAPAYLYWGGAIHQPPRGGGGIGGSSPTEWPDGPYEWPTD